MDKARTLAQCWRQTGRVVLVIGLGALLSACAAVRGGPQTFLDVESMPITNDAMRNLSTAPSAALRNQYLRQAMADVDAFYVPYRNSLLRSDNQFNATVDLLALVSDVAGRAAGATAAKDNYLSFGVLMSGTRATVNNRFFYAQTGIALVKGMDAARAERALAIKHRQVQLIDKYTGRDAYADVLQYYFDGTLAGGLIWLQSNANKNEAKNQAEMARLKVPTDAQFKLFETLSDEVDARMGNEAAMRRALVYWKLPDPGPDIDAVRTAFLAHFGKLHDDGLGAAAMRHQLTQSKFFED